MNKIAITKTKLESMGYERIHDSHIHDIYQKRRDMSKSDTETPFIEVHFWLHTWTEMLVVNETGKLRLSEANGTLDMNDILYFEKKFGLQPQGITQ